MSGTEIDLEGDVRSDAELVQALREGDSSGMDELYRRHHRMSLNFAASLAGATLAPDLVAEAFVRILDRIQRGGGPQGAFRAYLYTTIRNAFVDHVRHHSRQLSVPDFEPLEAELSLGDGAGDRFEHSVIQKAFQSLPDRWQAALWYTTVEGESLDNVGGYLGIAPNAVAVLTFRAREGLRQAYLAEHVNLSLGEDCIRVVEALPKYVRGHLRARMQAVVEAHLCVCRPCTAAATELESVNSGLRGLLLPALLGPITAGFLDKVLPMDSNGAAQAAGEVAASGAEASGTVSEPGLGAHAWRGRVAGLVGTAAAVGAVVFLTVPHARDHQESPDQQRSPSATTWKPDPVRTPVVPGATAAPRGAVAAVRRSVEHAVVGEAIWERLTRTSTPWYHLRIPVRSLGDDLDLVITTSVIRGFHVHREPGYGAWDCGSTDWNGPDAAQRLTCVLPAGTSSSLDFAIDVQAVRAVKVEVSVGSAIASATFGPS